MRVDGRAWPGYGVRRCPVCAQGVASHREPANDEGDEVVVYHDHWDGSGEACLMNDKHAALAAVAFDGAGR